MSKTTISPVDQMSGSASAETLDTLVARQILPGLLLAHGASASASDDGGAGEGAGEDAGDGEDIGRHAGQRRESAPITPEEANRFAEWVLRHDAPELFEIIEAQRAGGASVESILIHLLAPAARRLGEYWESDSCDFVDVTMGLWRLQEVMREMALAHPAPRQHGRHQRSALFAPMPGDQHSFGTLMIEELFARSGWDSEALPLTQRSSLLQICSEHSFDLVGLTVTNDCHSGDLANLVTAIRSVSQSAQVKIILGGRAVQTDPSLITLAGADGTADNAVSALDLADRLVPPPTQSGYPVLQPETSASDAHTQT